MRDGSKEIKTPSLSDFTGEPYMIVEFFLDLGKELGKELADFSALVHVKVENNKVVEFLDEFDILDVFITTDQATQIRQHYDQKYGIKPTVKPQADVTDARDGEPMQRSIPGFISFDISSLNKAIKEGKLKLTVSKDQVVYF